MIHLVLSSATVMVVIGATSVLLWLITLEKMMEMLVAFIQGLSSSNLEFLLLFNIVLLILGLMLDPAPAIFLTTYFLYRQLKP